MNMQHRNIIIALVFAACTGGAAMANDDVPVETKREFREKVAQRNRIIRELAKIDGEAANATLAGRDPIQIHADQIEMQDRVDLLQLRLETMSVRWGMPIPQPPQTDPAGIRDEDEEVAARIGAAFEDGRVRTNGVLRARCLRMLASIDYAAFLGGGR